MIYYIKYLGYFNLREIFLVSEILKYNEDDYFEVVFKDGRVLTIVNNEAHKYEHNYGYCKDIKKSHTALLKAWKEVYK